MIENKLFLKILYTSSTSTFIHSARRQKIYQFDFSKINRNGYNILNEKIKENLFFNIENKNWDKFETLNQKDKNIYEILKNSFDNKFEKIGLNKKDYKRNKLLTQYIVSISPDFFENGNLIKYNEFLINNSIKKWGIEKIISEEKIIDVFNNINDSLIKINTIDTKYNNFIGSVIHLDEKTPHMHSFFSNIDLNNDIKITRKNNSAYIDLRINIEKELNKIYWIKENDLYKIKVDKKEKSHQKWKDDFVKDYKKMEKKYNLEELKKLAIEFKKNESKEENVVQNNLLEYIESKNKEINVKEKEIVKKENVLSNKDLNITYLNEKIINLEKEKSKENDLDKEQMNFLKYIEIEEEKARSKDKNNLKNILNSLEKLKKEGYKEISISSNKKEKEKDSFSKEENNLNEKEIEEN